MVILRGPLPLAELDAMAKAHFGDMEKAVVDVRRRVMALGGDLHSDEETLLLDDGSNQGDLWGVNLYPGIAGEAWLEYDSMINLRPSQGNRSRGIDDPAVRGQVREVVEALIRR